MPNDKEHWEKVYAKRTDHEVGWYQEMPATSLRLIQKYSASTRQQMIDIGGGNSNLCRELLLKGYDNFSVLDISGKAIERSMEKIKGIENRVQFIESSVLELNLEQKFDIWHDRAVFHFILDKHEIASYAEIAEQHISPGGYLLIGAFAPDGPEKCSGLPVNRQSVESLEKTFKNGFTLLENFHEDHITPGGNVQKYLFVVFRRN